MNYCSYFQAKVDQKKTWFLVATLRSVENLVFDRALDVEKGVFEFFVPEDLEKDFFKIINFFEEKNIVSDFKRVPNRLMK